MDSTSRIGLFRIVSESSVAAGTRRIEAVTGMNVLRLLENDENSLRTVAGILKTSEKEVTNKAEALVNENKALQKQIAELNSKMSLSCVDDLIASAETVGDIKFIAAEISASGDALREVSDAIREKCPEAVCILASTDAETGKVSLALGVGKKAGLKAQLHAGKMIKEAAMICGGGGGGRPDSATAGGKDPSKLNEAFAKVKALIS